MRFVLFSKRNQPRSLNTTFLLLAQYNGKVVIPLEEVRRDFFSHLTLQKLLRKLSLGDIKLRVRRMDRVTNAPKASICKTDLADYFETRRQAAKKELSQMSGWN